MNDDLIQDLMHAVVKDPVYAAKLALYLRRRQEPVPDFVLQALTDIEDDSGGTDNSYLNRVARDYLLTDEDVPEILLNMISKNAKNSYYLALDYKQYHQTIPDKILKTIQNSRWAEPFQTTIRRMAQDEDDETANPSIDAGYLDQLLNRVMQDEDYALNYVRVLVKNKKDVPEKLQKMFMASPELAKNYASVVLGNGGTVPEEIINEIIKEPSVSFEVASEIIDKFKNLAPEIVIRALAKNSFLSSAYAVKVLKQNIINHKIFKILEHGILKGTSGNYKKNWSNQWVSSSDEKDSGKKEAIGNYAIVYSRVIGELPPPEILKELDLGALTYVASNLALQQKPVPVDIIEKISKNLDQSYRFVGRYYLKYGTRNLPKEYKKIEAAAKKYDKGHI